jgi:hypothetical protein
MTITSPFSIPSPITDACTRGASSEVVVAYGTPSSLTFKLLSCSTGAQVGSDIDGSAFLWGPIPASPPYAPNGYILASFNIGMVTPNILAITTQASQTYSGVGPYGANPEGYALSTFGMYNIATSSFVVSDTINLTIGGSTGSEASMPQRSQTIDGDATYLIAFGVSPISGKLYEFNGSASTVSLVACAPNVLTNGTTAAIQVVCSEGSGSGLFLFGTSDGRIIEMDHNLNLVSQFNLPRSSSWIDPYSAAVSSKSITSIHYCGGWLTFGCSDGYIYLMNWATKQIMQRRQYCSGSFPIISREGGITFASTINNTSSGFYNALIEWDMFLTPMPQKDSGWISSRSSLNVGFDNSKAYVWSANAFGLDVYNFSGQRSTTNQNEGCPYGGSVPGETIIIDDGSGTGNSQVMFHTPLAAGGQAVPVTSGRTTLLKAENIGKGYDKEDSINRMTS